MVMFWLDIVCSQVAALLEQKDAAVNSLTKAQQEFELQMNELCRTVQQYKVKSWITFCALMPDWRLQVKDENQRTVEQKDRETAEIEQLRADHDKEVSAIRQGNLFKICS